MSFRILLTVFNTWVVLGGTSNLYSAVDKLLSSEDGGGIFDDPPAITESVMMPPDHGDDEDDFDNLQSRKKKKHSSVLVSFTRNPACRVSQTVAFMNVVLFCSGSRQPRFWPGRTSASNG